MRSAMLVSMRIVGTGYVDRFQPRAPRMRNTGLRGNVTRDFDFEKKLETFIQGLGILSRIAKRYDGQMRKSTTVEFPLSCR